MKKFKLQLLNYYRPVDIEIDAEFRIFIHGVLYLINVHASDRHGVAYIQSFKINGRKPRKVRHYVTPETFYRLYRHRIPEGKALI